MPSSRCPECRHPVSWFDRACRYCGTPNAFRRSLILTGAVLGAVILAGVAASLIVLRNGSAPGPAAVSPGTGGTTVTQQSTTDFEWLSKALKECDADASAETGILHFIVTPLIDEPQDDPGWRRVSINDIGNAILISAEDMLAGLKRGALKVSKRDYVLAVRDDKTSTILRWSLANGVKRFATKDAGLEEFKVQFQTPEGATSTNWGNSFKRQPGNCYWVNAILRL